MLPSNRTFGGPKYRSQRCGSLPYLYSDLYSDWGVARSQWSECGGWIDHIWQVDPL
jgi:hypothetical protein